MGTGFACRSGATRGGLLGTEDDYRRYRQRKAERGEVVALWEGDKSVLGYRVFRHWLGTGKKAANLEVIFAHPERGLPFRNDAFTALHSLDSFHRFSLHGFAGECLRVTSKNEADAFFWSIRCSGCIRSARTCGWNEDCMMESSVTYWTGMRSIDIGCRRNPSTSMRSSSPLLALAVTGHTESACAEALGATTAELATSLAPMIAADLLLPATISRHAIDLQRFHSNQIGA